MGQKTPLVNRIFFGIITFIFILSVLKVIYAYSIGADTPPWPFWIIFYGIPMLGFVLTAIKADIRLRLSKIWTPIGLVMLAFTLYRIIFAGSQYGILDTLLINSSESVIYAIALGLLLAFVDLNTLNKYAYLIGVTFVFTIIGVVHDNGYLLQGLPFEGDGLIDQFWFASGILFAYLAVKKFRAERPKLKRVLLFSGASIGIVILLIIAGNAIASLLPHDSWAANWLSAQKPPVDISCVGGGCSLPLYSNIYSPESTLCLKSNSTFRAGVQPFSIVVQDHGLVLCKFVMDTDTGIFTASCPHEIAPDVGNTASFAMVECSKNWG